MIFRGLTLVAVALLWGCGNTPPQQGHQQTARPAQEPVPMSLLSAQPAVQPMPAPQSETAFVVESVGPDVAEKIAPKRLEQIKDQRLRAVMAAFYQQRDWQPAFLDPHHPTEPVNRMIRFVLAVHELGLDPAQYGLEQLLRRTGGRCRMGFFDEGDQLPELEQAIKTYVPDAPRSLLTVKCQKEWWPAEDQVELLDVRLATAFFSLAATLAGRPPETTDWQGAEEAVATLVSLLPGSQRYMTRVAAFRRYLPYWSTGSFPTLGKWGKLKIGDFGPRVARLKRRLIAEGYLDYQAVRSHMKTFDSPTREAVAEYRRAYGLRESGTVNREVLAILNQDAKTYVKALWGSLNNTLIKGTERGGTHLLVNIPEYVTYYVRDGRIEAAYRSVVGFPYQEPGGRTPELSAVVDYVDLNPTWTPTAWVLDNELKRKARVDKDFFSNNRFVVRGDKYVQLPGPGNTLGQVVIGFANDNNISLHGTNEPKRFSYADRALSHGCVRVENIEELAARILDWAGQVPAEPLETIFKNVVEKRVELARTLPIYVIYDRINMLQDGRIALARDPYQLNKSSARRISLEPLLHLVSLARKGAKLASK